MAKNGLSYINCGYYRWEIVPIQYCLVLSVQEALSCPEELKFILIRPLQVKARFHPLLIMICLSLASLRIDIILTAAVGAVLHCICFNQLLLKLAHPCDPKRLGDRMLQMGFLKTNSANRTDKNIDEIATNESIIIE